jgi:hydroxyacylglutathione hydrolase
MFFKRFYDTQLAQASYLLGCQQSGETLVVDPNRDVEQYMTAAEAEGLRITHVTETHIHADFVSGARELAARTGAHLLLSDEGTVDWKYTYAAESGARLLRDGDTFTIGSVRVEALHTPGHTPEHLSLLVTDGAAGAGPWGILTGDFVFVGDVGRPDLLERAAGYANTMEAGARTLFRSLERFRKLPDHLQVWPGHGAGSACGKALGSLASSTVGYERLTNWGLAISNEDEFVHLVLAGQPEPPRYFAEMKRINKEGPRLLGGFHVPPHLAPQSLRVLLARGEVVVDTRPAAKFAAGHVPGTINIPLDDGFTTWAGWLLPYDRDIYLILDGSSPVFVEAAVRDLATIGLDRVAGAFAEDAVAAWAAGGGQLGTITQVTPTDVAALLERNAVTVVDVRGRAEWDAGHLPGARNVPLGYLADRINELPVDRPIVLHCQGGTRSSIGASILRARGLTDVMNMAGGYAAWQRAGLPTTRDAARGDSLRPDVALRARDLASVAP